MRVLGIETSCDETGAAVVENGSRLLSNVVATSLDLHVPYGGVVPEVAARSHVEFINPVIQTALAQASCTWDDIDAIAVTYGAGLGGCLLVGVLSARTLAIIKKKPLYAINHVEAHVYSNFLTTASLSGYKLPENAPTFPMLALIVSGGHSQLVLFRDHFDYTLLGQTHDDAIGEAFDKVAKVLGLPYPGGPSIAQAAAYGDPYAYEFPKAQMKTIYPALAKLRSGPNATRSIRLDGGQGSNEQRTSRTHGTTIESRKQLTQQSAKNSRTAGSAGKLAAVSNASGYDFSFSGLKTAVLRAVQAECGKDFTFPSFKLAELLSESQKNNFAASFQRLAIETVVDKTILAIEEFSPASVVIAGGVAASSELRTQLAARSPMTPHYTDPKLCTDNGAMVATLGCFKRDLKQPPTNPYSLEIQPNLSM